MKTTELIDDGYGVVTEPRTVRIERLLPGPIERVWSYLTESDKRGSWFASGLMELRVGGRVEHTWRNSELSKDDDPPPAKHCAQTADVHMHGTITACDPPRLLAYTWDEGMGEGSEVRFELAPRGGKVLLTLTHRRLSSRGMLVGVSAGWHTHLDILNDVLSNRPARGFWRTHTRLEAEYEERIGPQ